MSMLAQKTKERYEAREDVVNNYEPFYLALIRMFPDYDCDSEKAETQMKRFIIQNWREIDAKIKEWES